jgi:FMN phosphatase YigB (HAD superfamily)
VPRWLLLGFTGTLLDEASEHRACDATMAAVRRRYGVELEAEDLSGRFTLALMEIMRGEPGPDEPADFLPLFDAAPEIFGGLMVSLGYQVDEPDKVWFGKRFRADLKEHAGLHRDATQALPRLAEAGWRLGVVTDADPRLVADVLDGSPVGALCARRVSASEAGHVKPHPAGFRMALERSGARAVDVVAVGASYERDVIAAREAGIEDVVLLDRHDARTVEVPRVRSLQALVPLLARM